MKNWSVYLLALYFVSKIVFDFSYVLPSQARGLQIQGFRS
jgi:hypothetical protein